MAKPIQFTKDERVAIGGRIRDFFAKELDQDISQLQAEMVLEFFGNQIGGWFYNRGLADAQAVVTAKAEDIADAIYALQRNELPLR
ncbi:DUF2164 domain-containing protein [Brevundimonas sp.]|uniref:DUF2164 domain-containing protein n=1 Tax=Brevundimonas sp. TaxID=1871086 RepID=UPI00289FE6A2|nr:DUF2164 domain-containing protein [Brevundimonas sp.]